MRELKLLKATKKEIWGVVSFEQKKLLICSELQQGLALRVVCQLNFDLAFSIGLSCWIFEEKPDF